MKQYFAKHWFPPKMCTIWGCIRHAKDKICQIKWALQNIYINLLISPKTRLQNIPQKTKHGMRNLYTIGHHGDLNSRPGMADEAQRYVTPSDPPSRKNSGPHTVIYSSVAREHLPGVSGSGVLGSNPIENPFSLGITSHVWYLVVGTYDHEVLVVFAQCTSINI